MQQHQHLLLRHRRQRKLSTSSGEALLEGLKNYEACGVPTSAGVNGPSGFDLVHRQLPRCRRFWSKAQYDMDNKFGRREWAQGRMHALLGALGSPHAGLPVVHVAGTKGKGSVVTMLAAILKEAGYKVGTYTRHETFEFLHHGTP